MVLLLKQEAALYFPYARQSLVCLTGAARLIRLINMINNHKHTRTQNNYQSN